MVVVDWEEVERITVTRLVEVLYDLDDPSLLGYSEEKAAYTQDSMMDVLELMMNEAAFKILWEERNGIYTDTPTV